MTSESDVYFRRPQVGGQCSDLRSRQVLSNEQLDSRLFEEVRLSQTVPQTVKDSHQTKERDHAKFCETNVLSMQPAVRRAGS